MAKVVLVFVLVVLFAGPMVSCIGSEPEEREVDAGEEESAHVYSSLGAYVDGFYIDKLGADRAAECFRRWYKSEFGKDPSKMITPEHIRARYPCPSSQESSLHTGAAPQR